MASRKRRSSGGKKKKTAKKRKKRTGGGRRGRSRWFRLGEAFAMVLLIGAVIALFCLLSYRHFTHKPALANETPWTVNVPRGASVWGTWRNLVRDGAVDSSRWFAIWVAIEQPSCLQAGRHTIAPTETIGQMFETLCEPTAGSGVRVTLPEGLNIWQIGDRLQAAGVSSRSAFVERAEQPLHISLYELRAKSAEGFLFPDTWEFDAGTPAQEIIDKMVARFVDVWNAVNAAHPQGLANVRKQWGVGLYGVVKVASIVQKEAIVDDERPIIARVIYNRIAAGMPIQCDPTCVYGADRYRERPSPRWCRADANAWSTYAHKGLPPTPISNPGRASLAAAITPADDPNVLYFAARMDGSGRHVFASTLKAHNANVEKYLRHR